MKLIKIVTLSMLAAITANQVYAAEPGSPIEVSEEQKQLYVAYDIAAVQWLRMTYSDAGLCSGKNTREIFFRR